MIRRINSDMHTTPFLIPGVYAGIKLLKPAVGNIYNMDLVAGGAGGIDATTNYTLAKKYATLTTSRLNAGQGAAGNDIAQVVSAGPFDLSPGRYDTCGICPDGRRFSKRPAKQCPGGRHTLHTENVCYVLPK